MEAQINKADLVTIRDGNADDRNFILATWLRGLYYGDSWFKEIPKDIFMEYYHRFLEGLLNLPGVIIKVSCLKEDPYVILGYAVSRKVKDLTVLDWVFVKDAWRGIGLGRSLVPQTPDAVSHLTKLGKILKPVNCVFNPFLF